MKLFEQFKIQKSKNEPDHYELFVEGDCDDLDIVSKMSYIEKKILENDDYLLYFISYIFSWMGKRRDPAGKYFNQTNDWNALFKYADFCFLPQGYINDIHTVTEVRLDYVSNGIRYPMEIPDFDSLFDNDDDKKHKVLNSKN